MGAVGSDVAIETADVALMGTDLRALPDANGHAPLALSAAILLTLVPLAALGILGLATVVGAHELAELLVIANGVRAARRTAFHTHPAVPTITATPAPARRPASGVR